MLTISIISLFPEFFNSALQTSLLKKAQENKLVSFFFYNPREYTQNERQTVDDSPYGGGPGMLLCLEPLVQTLRAIPQHGRILLLTPSGVSFSQKKASELSKEQNITILCGRYEGVDARLLELFQIEEISIGDYILNGGETAALTVMEATLRLVPGFMKNNTSHKEESFSNNRLEYPQYTKPALFENKEVPPVLRSGNHQAIALWRKKESLLQTYNKRIDLLEKYPLDTQERKILNEKQQKTRARNLYIALVHYPVLGKDKKTISVSLTNLDIHDIARCACTYGLGAYYITNPIPEQKKLFSKIVSHWKEGLGSFLNSDRALAMEKVYCLDTIQDVVQNIEGKTGVRPYIVATSAEVTATTSYTNVRSLLEDIPVLLLFGTSHGLAEEALQEATGCLPPIRPVGLYNHLSVRSAVSIIIDRIVGDFY
ncbi:MAG: tRNA (guanosine(37)-N1)-methyltransferase TrmD [Desulfovibrionaceae bacterium]